MKSTIPFPESIQKDLPSPALICRAYGEPLPACPPPSVHAGAFPPGAQEPFPGEIPGIPSGADEPSPRAVPDVNEIIAILTGGGEFSDITKKQLETLHDFGCRLVALGSYSDAIAVFLRLCLNDCSDYRFWMGLGDCLRGAGNPEKAIDAYGMAGLCGALEAQNLLP
jgi:hypothetical protein